MISPAICVLLLFLAGFSLGKIKGYVDCLRQHELLRSDDRE